MHTLRPLDAQITWNNANALAEILLIAATRNHANVTAEILQMQKYKHLTQKRADPVVYISLWRDTNITWNQTCK
jgi:hypothetical protein